MEIDFGTTGHIIGIDLGTTNSLAAFMDLTGPRIIPGADGDKLVPSVVSIDPNGEIVVGNAARELLLTQPERTVYSVKRLMGRGLEDVQEELKLFPFHIAPGSESVIAAPVRRSHLHAARDFGLRPAPVEAERRSLLRRTGDARPSSRFRRTSTTPSARPPRTPDASPVSKFCAW